MGKKNILNGYLGLRFFSSLFFWAFATVNLVYQATVVGLNPLQLVLVGTLLEFCTFVFEVPTGIVADLYSRKISVIIGVILVGAGFMFEGLNPTFAGVLIAQVIWGIGYTFISGAREAWVADEMGERDAGGAFIKGQQAELVGRFIGIAVSMVLANIDIRLPLVIGGAMYAVQSFFVVLFMPETNFVPTPAPKRETFQSMKKLFVEGVGLVRHSGVLLVIIITGILFGAFSEGFDRLWTPYIIQNFTFPVIGGLNPVVWFGIIGMVEAILSIVVSEIIKRKTDFSNHRATVLSLAVADLMLIIGVIGFAISQSFAAVILLYWMAMSFRWARDPLYGAWVNQNITSKIRATMFSMCSQANAFGQLIGGPILGVIAAVISIKAGIIAAGLILAPVFFLRLHNEKL